ncbi:hypothetical protein [Yimella lutea]|uniref:hypothetical protein n=1 Tax=Yimella lutea TaxID=587872 RepID=UPI0031F04A2E
MLAGNARAVLTAARRGDAAAAVEALGEHRLLCAHHAGPQGVRTTDSPLLTRELCDTGVTRAEEEVRVVGSEEEVRVVGSEEVVRPAVARRVVRASGLRQRLGSTPQGD